MMKARTLLVYSHDSIGLGEDGPTHQPIEQLASLRAMPHMNLWRPCDAVETAVAWTLAIERQGPTALVLTRQGLPQQPRTAAQLANIRRGGYVLIDCQGTPEALVIATGSEVGIAAQAVNALNGAGRRVRLVSMPSTETFDAQDAAYRESVLPQGSDAPPRGGGGRDAVLVALCRQRRTGARHRPFGASGKGPEVFAHFGFTADNVGRQIRELLEG